MLSIAAFNWRVAMAVIAIPMIITAVVLRSTLPETEPDPSLSLRGTMSRPLLIMALAFGVIALVAVAGAAFFQFSLFPVGLAQASQYAPAGNTGGATGLVFGASGLLAATAQPLVGALAEPEHHPEPGLKALAR